jgi:hypothetical protein
VTSRGLFRAVAAGAVLSAVLLGPALAAGDPAGSAQDIADLGAIRDQIEALDLEKALAAIAALLARPDTGGGVRADALALRAQAHVASGDLAAAEADYREILPLRPTFAPDPKLTSKKAMERFLAIESAMIGTLHLDLDPKDASVSVDGHSTPVAPDASLKALAGERSLRVEHKGFDPSELSVHAVAGADTLVHVRLVPNARAIVVRTDVDGVDVKLDGQPAGTTAHAAGDAAGPAELQLEDVSIGEHALTLAKPCFATENVKALVTVDLQDRAPKPLPVAVMRPARTRVSLNGATYAGELRVDGERALPLPGPSIETCPGRHTIEAVASGRVVSSQVLEAGETDVTVDLTPRPNAVLVGPEWPASWVSVLGSWSLRGRVDPPPGSDLSSPAGWGKIHLPPDTDIAVGVITGGGMAGADRVVMWSPTLGIVAAASGPADAGRPVWRRAGIGATSVDGRDGIVRLVHVTAGGAAAGAGIVDGDGLQSVAGRPVSTAAEARSQIGAQAAGGMVPLEIVSPQAARRTVQVKGSAEPVVERAPTAAGSIVRAGWAEAVAAAGGEDAASAYANLALTLEGTGRDAVAAEAWRKAAALDPASFGPRADYASGAQLDAQGKSAEAKESFQRAKAGATAAGDLVLAAAAADRLADLGVSK